MELQSNNQPRTVSPNRKLWVALVAVLLLAGVAAVFYLLRSPRGGSIAGRPVPEPSGDFSMPGMGDIGFAPRPGDVMIEIPPEKLANAGLKIEPVVAQTSASVPTGSLRTTGTVESNAYKEIPVMPIAGGIVREVNAQLGDRVAKGQRLAVIFSTELSEAQATYLKMQAEIERHHHHYQRMEKLVEIGAASREEFEQANAEYKTEQANLLAMRQRLVLLGMTAKQLDELGKAGQISSLINVDAPAPGSILTRTVNPGEVVMTGKEMFRIADLSTVWVIGQVYERDFAAVHVGTAAAISTEAYPGKSFGGRVSYVDPRVDAQSRTSQVRIEVANPAELFRLGMFVDVTFGAAAKATGNSGGVALEIPRASLQFIGGRQVVYIATDKPGSFAQRDVQTGQEVNGRIPISGGLAAGDRIVTDGSFLLRAESLKLNPAQLGAQAQASESSPRAVTPPPSAPVASGDVSAGKTQTVHVALTERGFEPGSIKLRKGVPTRMTFTRKVEASCGTEIVIPDYGIKRDLPFNQTVTVEFTPNRTGDIQFACGMDMLKGKLIVR